ncbi:uncharacterized protein [Venturia canescens]|uniref:uncharacterized protein isoform X2 n=1 Tax=Venturia canescens TaxID=32260 RepID=UPI001C9CB2E1|nr:uncharacterized protein LOC122415692 isoform X2 [Venturia canescens]
MKTLQKGSELTDSEEIDNDEQRGNETVKASSNNDVSRIEEYIDSICTQAEESLLPSSLASAINNDSELMGLLNEIVPNSPARPAKFFDVDVPFRTSGGEQLEVAESVSETNSFLDQDDFTKAIEAPIIFSTPNSGTIKDCTVSLRRDETIVLYNTDHQTVAIHEPGLSTYIDRSPRLSRRDENEFKKTDTTFDISVNNLEGNVEEHAVNFDENAIVEAEFPNAEMMIADRSCIPTEVEDDRSEAEEEEIEEDDSEVEDEESNYKPSSNQSLSDSDEAPSQNDLTQNINRDSKSNSSFELSLTANMPGKSTRDDADMFVRTASGKKGLDRKSWFCRRPSANAPRAASHYKPCYRCKGFFSKKNIRHHAAYCFSYDGVSNRSLMPLGRMLLGRIHEEASKILRVKIFPVLREDEIVRVIRYDRLVILYGNKLAEFYGGEEHQHDMIRARLRLLGRFLLAIKLINKEITDFASIYQPKMYDDAVSAIQEIAQYDPVLKRYAVPSTAYSIGSLLKKVANLYIFDCIKREDNQQKARVEDFLKLLNEDISTSVNKPVLNSMILQKRRKKVELPPIADIKKLRDYSKTERQLALEALDEEFSKDAWVRLAEATLIGVQLFNRRRAGEIERVSIEDFQNHEGVSVEELKRMSLESQKAAKNYVRFTIRGKLNRTVPVLLSAELLKCVEKILEFREKAGVDATNPFIFGIPNKDKMRQKYLRACVLLRKFVKKADVDFPHKMTGTTLRKHVATTCINLDLSENEVAEVAQFMGHAEKIHRVHYRQSIVSREIVKMSKVLERAQEDPDGNDEKSTDSERDSGGESESEIRDDSSVRSVKKNKGGEMKKKNSKRAKKISEQREDSDSDSNFDSDSDPYSQGSGSQRKNKRSTSSHGPVIKRKRWSTEDKNIALELFGHNIQKRSYPSLKEIEKKCAEYPTLRSRKPQVIKTWISNEIKKRQR